MSLLNSKTFIFYVDSFGLFVVPSIYSCLVLHEVHSGLSLGPSPPISFLGIFLIVQIAALKVNRNCGIDVFFKKKEV